MHAAVLLTAVIALAASKAYLHVETIVDPYAHFLRDPRFRRFSEKDESPGRIRLLLVAMTRALVLQFRDTLLSALLNALWVCFEFILNIL